MIAGDGLVFAHADPGGKDAATAALRKLIGQTLQSPALRQETAENSYEIVYEEIKECKGGRTRGKREKMPVLEFLESPLVRALGSERVERLKSVLGK